LPTKSRIDATIFTALFRQRHKNHKAICATLYQLVATLSKMPSLHSPGHEDDAIQDALLHCIERIDRFTYSKDGNAFSYYTSVAIHALRHCRARNGKERGTLLFSQFNDPNEE